MANVPYSHNMGAHGQTYAGASSPMMLANSLNNITNIVAAGLSVALIVGVGVWGYKLMVRDVTGLPVVQAISGEMRVLPDNPGVELALNQGLSVNEVAAAGTAAAPTDTLVLAPKPVALAVEDTPVSAQVVAPVQQLAPLDLSAAISNPIETVAVDTTSNIPEAGSVEDLVRQLTQGADVINTTNGAKVVSAVTTVASTNVIENAAIQAAGLRHSLRPLLRPASAPAVVIPVSAPAKTAVTDVDPTSVPAGTRLVQLGAFDSAEVARSQWDKIEGRFGDFLQGKSRIVQKANSGGRTFYRLRAMGFSDLSDARRFCSALLAENADCIPVVTR
ncbi:SPOR domain-containing protein [Ascidiaceihabitans sp.]|nr:SPOR domain-containing protein [Ascidiaceihabitans sp.]